MKRQRPVVVAHRGLHTLAPENSVEAFALAWQAGLTWCECDVRLSRDGHFIVIHDDTLDRTTTAQGRVAGFAAEELLKLRLRDAEGEPRFAQLPSLAQALSAMPASAGMLVELKDAITPALGESLVRLLRGRRVVVQSFLPENLLMVHEVSPVLPLALLIERASEVGAATNGPWSAVHADHLQLDAQAVARLRAAGKSVGAWTVTNRAEHRRVLRLGVDTVISDDPLGG